MSPGELPKTGVAVSDKAIHLVEYAIMGILAWGAFGKGGAGFPWGLLAFVPVLELRMNAGRTGWEQEGRLMFGMPQRTRQVPLLA